ncbi:MAG: GEVED domain-containing protein [Planctomycetota bacterium]
MTINSGQLKAELLKDLTDILPDNGQNFSNPSRFISAGSKTFFLANLAPGFDYLYVTDGTADGTRQLSEANGFDDAVVLDGHLYFENRITGGLWRSDGTPEGTKELLPEFEGIRQLQVFDNRIFFTAEKGLDNVDGVADGLIPGVWSSDGTRGGTRRVQNNYGIQGSAGLQIHQLQRARLHVVDDRLLIFADSFEYVREQGVDVQKHRSAAFWKYQGLGQSLQYLGETGTEGNTGDSLAGSIPTLFGQSAYFFASVRQRGETWTELWRLEGDAAMRVQRMPDDFAPGPILNFDETAYTASFPFGQSKPKLVRINLSSGEVTDTGIETDDFLLGLLATPDYLYFRQNFRLMAMDKDGQVQTLPGSSPQSPVPFQDGVAYLAGDSDFQFEIFLHRDSETGIGQATDFPGEVPAAGVSLLNPTSLFPTEIGLFFPARASVEQGFEPYRLVNEPAASLSISDLTIAEGSGGSQTLATMTVTLHGNHGAPLSVDYRSEPVFSSTSSDFGDLDGSDLVLESNSSSGGSGEQIALITGTLDFEGNDGESQTITIPIAGDDIVETSDTILVRLLPTDVKLTRAVGRLTIVNDDVATIRIGTNIAAVTEDDAGSTEYPFQVSIDKQVDGPVWVDFDTFGKSASHPSDIQRAFGTLDFEDVADGQLGISVPVFDDTLIEGDEDFEVALTNLQAGGLEVRIEVDRAAGIILDDDFAIGLDLGDAPEGYPVRIADDGARHRGVGVRLGGTRDTERGGEISEAADGDDVSGNAADDEDGVAFATSIVSLVDAPTIASISVEANDIGFVDAWIDFDGDGRWTDPGERIADSLAVEAGMTLISFNVPAGVESGEHVARFRISQQGGLDSVGYAETGEVEDHLLAVEAVGAGELIDAAIMLQPAISATVSSNNDQIRVVADEVARFEAPRDVVNQIRLMGTGADDVIQISQSVDVMGVSFDGNDGVDRLDLLGANQSLDLTQLPSDQIRSLEVIDLRGNGTNRLTGDGDSVARIIDSNDLLTLITDGDDQVDVGLDWTFTGAEVVDGQFVRVFTQNPTIRFIGPHDWSNPIDRFDVNAEDGVTAADALVIINELNRARYHRGSVLVAAVEVEPFPGFFYDVNLDGRVTALDALQVINQLSATGTRQLVEAEVLPSPTVAPQAIDDLFARWDASSEEGMLF